MRTYEYQDGEIVPGLPIIEDQQRGPVVVLGEGGRRPRQVALDKINPAEVKAGRVMLAWPKSIRSRFGSIVLSKPLRSTPDIIVRVNTAATELGENSGNGEWETKYGEPQILAQSEGQRLSGAMFCDDLIQLGPNDAITIKTEGQKVYHEVRNDRGRIKFICGDKPTQPVEA